MTNKTKSGKTYETEILYQGGCRASDTVRWEIRSEEVLSQEDVEEIIESQYPFAGYGSSGFGRFPKHEGKFYRIEVTSNASCD